MFLSLLLAATVVVGEREFPTYPYSDPDPVPAPEKYYWPYVRHDGTTDEVVTQKWNIRLYLYKYNSAHHSESSSAALF